MKENECPNCGCKLMIVAQGEQDSDYMTSDDMDKAMAKEMKSKGKLEEYG